MTLKHLDLSEKLQQKQRQSQLKSVYWLGGTSLLVLVFICFLALGLPWHWQLFFHWLLRRGDVTSIPVHLYPEIRELCQQSNKNGQVNGYHSSPEIAYGLGRFKCRRSPTAKNWEISDKYGFAEVSEAAAGTQIAELLVAVMGTDYFYEIRGTIPLENPPNN
ncbi:hypothetical protein VB715_11260 [Crocosphaera sp. UHCC 0190]|uniref:hypothetical protein n=1 Tax=Crocosphaera sp. UHCC 0190 TaxID=3110246 RepID=UPI002B218184|nr:hypothetical protein [Crocosphaera sp. UHCC 0190]MEA5510342.1 hypothetical protein [Crocosphaera sp. UHCC 0190]